MRTTAAGWRALALAAAGLFAMAVVGAAPGSPYQPLLTPGGRPHGPLTDLAVRLRLDAIPGNPILALGAVVSIGAVVAFLLLLRAAYHGRVGIWPVVTLVLGAHALLLGLPLLFSRDVYSYAFYGRIAGVYGENPYVAIPLDHPTDALWRFVGPIWVNTPAVYGPVWSSLSGWLSTMLRARPEAHVEAYRMIAVVASLLTCAVIVWTVRRLWPERTAFALVAFGANPVVVFHSVASGHNDMLVALAITVAFALVVSHREMPAIAVLTLGALIKATAGLPLILLLVWCIARRPPQERWRVAITHVGLAAAITAVFSAPYVQLQDPTLGMLTLAGHEGWLAPAAVGGHLVDMLTFHTMGWVVRLAAGVILVISIWRLARAIWRRTTGTDVAGAPVMSPREQAATWGWVLMLLMLLGPVLLPWYVAWALPLAWVLPKAPRTALIATSALLGATLWSTEPLRYPGAFSLNVFVGNWIVVPVIVVLLLWVLYDLRSRIEGGLLFEDEFGLQQPAPLTEQPAGEQRVSDATDEDAGDRRRAERAQGGAEAFQAVGGDREDRGREPGGGGDARRDVAEHPPRPAEAEHHEEQEGAPRRGEDLAGLDRR
jgi:alpha-1,6-mannosyltransferase